MIICYCFTFVKETFTEMIVKSVTIRIVNEYNTAWIESEYEARGWSMAYLSKRAGRAQSGVSMVLSGQRDPTYDFIADMATALGISKIEAWRKTGLLKEHDVQSEVIAELSDRLEPRLRDFVELLIRSLVSYQDGIQRISPPVEGPLDEEEISEQIEALESDVSKEWLLRFILAEYPDVGSRIQERLRAHQTAQDTEAPESHT